MGIKHFKSKRGCEIKHLCEEKTQAADTFWSTASPNPFYTHFM